MELQRGVAFGAIAGPSVAPEGLTRHAADQQTEVRGVIDFCSGCVRATPCELLLPGG